MKLVRRPTLQVHTIWSLVAAIGLALPMVACGSVASQPPTPTPPPTAATLPTIPRPALDTPGPQPSVSAAPSVVHVVAAGDSLGSIAVRYYGDSSRWQRIYEANRGVIPDPNALAIGTRLNIPPPQ
jgi:nucleoid-associated protein YgaU